MLGSKKFVCLLILAISTLGSIAHGQAATPATPIANSTSTSLNPEGEADEQGSSNPMGWGAALFFHGIGRHHGVGAAVVTPHWNDTIGLRVGFAYDQTNFAGTTSHASGQTILVDLQYAPPVEDPDMFRPYLNLPIYTTFTGDSGANSANASYGVLIGADFGYWLGRSAAEAVPRSFFIEGGLMHSDIEVIDGTARADMYRGFLVRFGVRQ